MALANCSLIWLHCVARRAAVGADERLRSEDSRLDRRPDPLAAFGIGKTGGVADEQDAVADERPHAGASRMIRVTVP